MSFTYLHWKIVDDLSDFYVPHEKIEPKPGKNQFPVAEHNKARISV